MRMFRHLWAHAPGAFLTAALASVVSGSTGALFIVLVDQALRQPDAERTQYAPAFVAVCLTTILSRVLAQVLLYRLAQDAVRRLRRTLVDRFLDTPLRRAEQLGPERLYSALSDDVVTIGNAIPGVPAVCSNTAFAVVAVGYLTSVSPVVALAALGAMVVAVVLYLGFARYGSRRLACARRDQDAMFGLFRAVTSGRAELTLNRDRRRAVAGTRFDDVAGSFRRSTVLGQSIYEGAAGAGQLVFFAFVGLLLFVLAQAAGLSGETLTACVLVLIFVVTNVQGVLVWFPAIGRASVALDAIDRCLAALPPEPGLGEARDLPGPAAAVRLEGVRHVYPGPTGESFELGPVDLELRRGEVLFVTGGNGSGKTTLGKIVTGLYPPQAGRVLVDGTAVGDRERQGYRELFSAIFSDFYLFEELDGLPADDRATRTQHYLERLQIAHKVRLDGGRFSTTALSQGQRKRLALVVAYLEDRPFYLFDEWAADQDPAFRRLFYEELLPELRDRGKGVVVITHDDRYFHLADRLVRLADGHLREGGDRDAVDARSRA
ncbi:MAG TPA: cyclic peptide export ABC transporter [Cellulomonas sp.]